MLNLDFLNRHAVVTGGTGALGTAVVQMLVDAGAVCHIPAHARPDPARFPLARHERVRVTAGIDLTDENAVAGFYSSLPSLWASVHTAGGFSAAPINETTLAMWKQMLDTNSLTCFLCCREAVRKIRASGGAGRIVNVAAKPVLVPTGGLSAYAASKAAVASLTLSLSEELAAESIWVNAVIPSLMTHLPTAKPCPRPTSTSGRRCRKSRRRSCFWPPPRIRPHAEPWFPCTAEAD